MGADVIPHHGIENDDIFCGMGGTIVCGICGWRWVGRLHSYRFVGDDGGDEEVRVLTEGTILISWVDMDISRRFVHLWLLIDVVQIKYYFGIRGNYENLVF